MLEGFSGVQILNQLHDLMLPMDELQDKQKSAIFERLAVRAGVHTATLE